jgi:hypothetical protein
MIHDSNAGAARVRISVITELDALSARDAEQKDPTYAKTHEFVGSGFSSLM